MKNTMQMFSPVRFCFLLSCFCMLCLVYGCENETYESGEGQYSGLRADFGDVKTLQTKTLVSALLDNGREVKFEPTLSYEWAEVPATTYRALIYYYETTDLNVVKPYMAQQVYVLPWRNVSLGLSSIMSDPVHVESFWISENNSYINFRIGLMVGKDDDGASKMHKIGINHDNTSTREDGSHVYELTFVHSQNGVPEYYTTHQYLSLPIKDCAQGDQIVVTVNTYNGLKQYKFDI